MAADLSIHVMAEDVTEEQVRAFRNPFGGHSDFLLKQIMKCPSVWVGEVSWLKAALTGDEDAFIPDPVGEIAAIFSGIDEVTDEKIKAAALAMTQKNQCDHYSIAKKRDVIAFLEAHKGKKSFTISW